MGNPLLFFDLSKAQRNLSKLVPKQVQVTRNGKTFMQTVYVDPSTGQQPSQSPTSPIDFQEFMRLAYGDKDRAKAMKYLEDNGVTWNKNPHDGVNWMRAAMAAQTAAGLAPTAAPASGVSKPTAATPSTSTAQGSTQKKGARIDYHALATAGFDKADGKTKVALLKKVMSRDDFLVLAHVLTSWDRHSMEAIDFMRASMAMAKWCDSNDLNSLSRWISGKALDQATADAAAAAQAPATKAKQPKAQTPATPAPPPPPKDELEVRANHTPRQQGIIHAINAISDPTVLKGLARVGIVPEDADAQDFVLARLGTEYDKHIRPSLSGTGGYRRGWYSDHELQKDFAKRTTKVFKGVHQKIIAGTARTLVQPEMLYDFVDPRSGISISTKGRRGYGQNTRGENLFQSINNMFGGYSGVEAPEGANLRYSGKDKARWGNALSQKGIISCEAAERLFNPDKEGFVLALRHIGASDPKLKAAADDMEATYLQMMQVASHNPTVVYNIMNYSYSSLEDQRQRAEKVRERGHALIECLRSYGLSDDDIRATIEYNDWRNYVNEFVLCRRDPNTGRPVCMEDDNGDRMIATKLQDIQDSTGAPMFRHYVVSNWDNDTVTADYANALLDNPDAITPELDILRRITPEVYDSVLALQAKMMGVKFIDHNTQAPIDPSIPPHEWDDSMWYEAETIKDGDALELDAIITNLSFMLNMGTINDRIANHIGECPDSAANQQGTDYSGNFTYTGSDKTNTRTVGTGAAAMTPEEKASIMIAQLHRTPIFTFDELQTLSEYVQNNGDPSQSLSYGMSANETLSRIKSLSPQKQGFDGIQGTPINDIYQRYIEAALQYCPQVYTTRVTDDDKMRAWARKTLGFVPYAPATTAGTPTDPAATSLHQLRAALFQAAHCTLRTADAQEYQDITHRVKMDFDYVDPATGKRVDKSKRAYDDRSLALHGKVFVISNSEQEERFRAEAARMGEQPVQMYHGTSYGGAAGIVGVEGKFRISGKNTSGLQTSGSMLGQGIYMAKLVGKTLPYMGNNKYSYSHYTIDAQPGPTAGYASDGCLLVCDALMGKHYHSDISTGDAQRHNDGTYDSVSVGAGAAMGGTTLKEYECIVRRNNQIMPKFIVECGGRSRR